MSRLPETLVANQRATARSGVLANAPKYPHPFFDLGQSYLPNDIKQLFNWTKFYFTTNPVVNAAITKMAEYPITSIIFKTNDTVLKEKYEEIVKILKLKSFRIEVGLDYFTYGNAFVSIMFPFKKYLECSSCHKQHDIKSVKYKWLSFQYNFKCPSCGNDGFAKVHDNYVRSIRDIRLMRWNPEFIDIEYNELSGKTTIIYNIPNTIINQVMLGKPAALEELPDIFIQAIKQKKKLYFHPDNIFHFKRPTLSQKTPGWGTPLVLPVLKDLHYMGVLRRAQEAVAQEHIVPLRVLFPSQGTTTSDPFSTINLSDWKQEVEEQIAKWKVDPNRIPVMPLPLGSQIIGGDGKALLLHQEYRVWSEHIAAGMGVPPEFIFGGIQYSSTNLTMFQLHNKFLGYIEEQKELVFDFIFKRIAAYMGWPKVKGDFKPFKMADDLQRTMLYFQLNQAQKISDATLLEDIGMDISVERDRMNSERGFTLELQRRMQKEQAHIQGEVAVVNNKYQLDVQQAQMALQMAMQPQQPGMAPPGQDPNALQDPNAQQDPNVPAGALSGNQVAPGFPEGASVYPENSQNNPATGVKPTMGNPNETTPSGMSLQYIAKRAANYLETLDEGQRSAQLNIMRTANPELFTLVNQIIQDTLGSQSNPLNAAQMPMPEQKPQRRDPSRQIGS